MKISHREPITPPRASPYSVERELGRGATAVVYLARDLKHNRWVALKVLREELAATLQAERFLREIQIAAGLSHPHILPLHDSGEMDGRLFYVMPFVEGESLRQRLERDGTLPIHDALRIAGEVASALDYAHRRGVVHRDIKPENILLEDGQAVVADFGIARALTNAADALLTLPGLGVGTAAYMSPEQVAGEREIDGRSDVYSLGCVLYEMLAGEAPFKGPNVQAIMARRFIGVVPSVRDTRSEVPLAVNDVVTASLAREMESRFATAGLFANALSEATRSLDLPVAAPRPSPRQPDARGTAKTDATRLFGRDDALAEVSALLEQDRLVTILGPGGVGKSRLAREIAAREAGDEDRCYFVPLTAVAAPQYVAVSIAEALGLGAAGGRDPRLQILDFLRGRNALLVLDNFEHLVGDASLVGAILDHAPDVRVLVTSRQRLNLQREAVYELGTLPVPPTGSSTNASESPAVRLFLAHARRYRSDVRSWDAELPAIIRVCRSVDGLPLGIEIAAALLRALSCQEIAAELERSLDSLVTPLRDVPERHRSLRTVFEQSWSLLDDAEREALAKLSVLKGSFDRTAAEYVARASLPVLMALIDKSLLTRAGAGRYQLHDVLRQYSAAKALMMATVRADADAAHASYFADHVRIRYQRLAGSDQQVALDEIATELGNIRAGWKWAQDHGDEDLLAAYGEGLYRYYTLRGWFREGADDLSVVEGLVGESIVVGRLLACYGHFCWRLGLTAKARDFHRRSLAILRHAGDDATVAPLRGLANIATELGKYRAAERLHRRCVELCRTTGNRYELALSYSNWSIPATELGHYADAEHRLREALRIHKELGNLHGVAVTLGNLANVLETQDKLEEARAPLEEGIAIARQLGNKLVIAAASLNLGSLRFRSGHVEEGERLLQESVEQFREVGVRDGLATALFETANASLALGRYEEAKERFREALACAVQLSATGLTIRVMVGMADLFSWTDEPQRAVSILQAVLNHPAVRDYDLRRGQTVLARLGAVQADSPPTTAHRTSTRDLKNLLDGLLVD